jgi:hypothetical protein
MSLSTRIGAVEVLMLDCIVRSRHTILDSFVGIRYSINGWVPIAIKMTNPNNTLPQKYKKAPDHDEPLRHIVWVEHQFAGGLLKMPEQNQ